MSSPKVTQETCNSRKHLATDFDWEGLEGLDLPAIGFQGQHNDNLLPERCIPSAPSASQGTTAKPFQYDPQPFAFPLLGEDLTPDSRPL